MSKRKYNLDVSKILYTWNVDGETAYRLSCLKEKGISEPVRIVRESFYRRIVKEWEDTPNHHDYMEAMRGKERKKK
jgi:hypothetical protein